jgi:hypothetical protein
LVPDALERAYWQLPPAASIRRRTAARDSRACIAFASFDAARGATSTPNASHAFSAAGLVPFNAAKPLASQYVRNCEEDVERAEEAKHPGRIHTGSRVLTSADFLARLTVDEGRVMRQICKAQCQGAGRVSAKRGHSWLVSAVRSPELSGMYHVAPYNVRLT